MFGGALTEEALEYHKLEMVGEGEISVVYKVVHLKNGSPLAIKEFKVSILYGF